MSFTQVPPDSTGNKIDTVTLTDGVDTVHRQVVVIGDDGSGSDVVSQLKVLTDTLVFVAGAILEKMPRVTGNDQVAVSIEGGSVGINSGTTLSYISTINAIGGRWANGDNMNQAGVLHLYNQIVVV